MPEDVAFATDKCIRPENHCCRRYFARYGRFSIMSSDSQAMGRVGEVVTRTWQTADKMKAQIAAR